ncbi:MAG: glycosyltransferase family 2 protein [Candidatus Eremiobacterota bacterium]
MLSWILALFWWVVAFRLYLAIRRVASLADEPLGPEPRGAPAAPLAGLSVVVAASNEADHVEEALSSLLQVDYPDLEVVAVNDRSTDATGEILDRMARLDPRLTVVHVRELPPGWLGKTHALQRGAERARHSLLLFTDADVHFSPDSLRRAVGAMLRRGADHLVVSPYVVTRSFWETAFVSYFNVLFQLRFQPDLADRPGHPAYLGVGAFNMLRAEVYRAVGGHGPVALDVTDDMSLGRLVKRSGYRPMVLNSGGLVRVRWMVGLAGIIGGLEKNAYAGTDYSMSTVLAACAWILATTLGTVLCFDQAAGGLAVGGMLLCGALAASMMGLPRWGGALFPVTGPLFCYVLLRSAWLTERRGGVVWRGTFYPLPELREFLRRQQLGGKGNPG